MQMNRVRLYSGERVLLIFLPWCYGIGSAFVLGVAFIPLPYSGMEKIHIIGVGVIFIFIFIVCMFFLGKHSKEIQKRVVRDEIESYQHLILFLHTMLENFYKNVEVDKQTYLREANDLLVSMKKSLIKSHEDMIFMLRQQAEILNKNPNLSIWMLEDAFLDGVAGMNKDFGEVQMHVLHMAAKKKDIKRESVEGQIAKYEAEVKDLKSLYTSYF